MIKTLMNQLYVPLITQLRVYWFESPVLDAQLLRTLECILLHSAVVNPVVINCT